MRGGRCILSTKDHALYYYKKESLLKVFYSLDEAILLFILTRVPCSFARTFNRFGDFLMSVESGNCPTFECNREHVPGFLLRHLKYSCVDRILLINVDHRATELFVYHLARLLRDVYIIPEEKEYIHDELERLLKAPIFNHFGDIGKAARADLRFVVTSLEVPTIEKTSGDQQTSHE